jgi:hypothetical protein
VTHRLLLALPLVAAGCLFSPKQIPFRYYTLRATVDPAGAPRALRIGLGPISFPGYLDRTSLTTRVNPEEVRYATLDRWAEPVDQQFLRTLAEDLGNAAGTMHVVAYPWYPSTPLDVAVRVDVLAFETDAAGSARLVATWTVRDVRTQATGASERTVLSEVGRSGDNDAGVAALSRLVGELARRIADTLPSPAKG